MAAGIALPGYMGIVKITEGITSATMRCSSTSINVTQEIESYDHVIGINDTVPTTKATKGEAIGTIQTQKILLRPSVIAISGGLSFPTTENQTKFIFELAKYGKEFEVEINYLYSATGNVSKGRKFKKCRVNTMGLQLAGGEVGNMDLNIMAQSWEDCHETIYDTSKRLANWATNTSFTLGGISITDGSPPIIESFDLQINNNANAVYRNQGGDNVTNANLYPFEIRLGKQEVSGSVGVYLYANESLDCETGAMTQQTISFSFDNIAAQTINVLWKRRQIDAVVGPVMTSLQFMGVEKAFGA